MCGRGAANTPNTLPLIEITHTKEYRHMATHACVTHGFIHNISSQFSPGNLKEESHFGFFFYFNQAHANVCQSSSAR